MMIYRCFFRLITLTLSVLLVACTSSEQFRNGPSLEVFPISHALALVVEKKSFEKSKQQLDIYLEEYADILVTQIVTIKWSNEDSKKLADLAKERLLSMGVAPNYIEIEHATMQTPSHFDFEIKVVQYQVSNMECERSISQNYYLSDNGCFTESARWRSMVAPERMFPSLKQAQE